jgi:hypothetical protein
MARLARISVTPVKGTALVHPREVQLTPGGIPGNRRFLLASADGDLVDVFQVATLVQVRSDLDPEHGVLRCTFPDGRIVEGPADDLGEQATVTGMEDHDAPGRIVHGAFAEAFSAFLGRPVMLVRADRDVDGSDVEPLTLVSQASVDDLAARGGHEGDLDIRRFRMNLELEQTRPYEEDSWDGRLVAIGEAVVRIAGQVPRCRVTTRDPDTGERDFPTLKVITSYRPLIDGTGIPFGMYARVETPGVARVGDAVVPIAAP